MELRVRAAAPDHMSAGEFEVVERKGLGHPDTLADALAERLSVAYSKLCLEKFGVVLHHNLDKVYLRGGSSHIDFGTFTMIDPIDLYIGGRASTELGGKHIAYEDVFERIAREYFRMVFGTFDDRWLRVHHLTTDRSRFREWFHPRGLADLPDASIPVASDTAAVTSWWPNTPTEEVTLQLERYLNIHDSGPRYEDLGQDVKVMSVRTGKRLHITALVPVKSQKVDDGDGYRKRLDELEDELKARAGEIIPKELMYDVVVNPKETNNPFAGKRAYLLGMGSCLELGEEGMVGRGNGARGLSSVVRPKSVEAPYGKNPIYHSGKVYTILADAIAKAVSEYVRSSCEVSIVSLHSDPLRRPSFVDVLVGSRDFDLDEIGGIVERTLDTTDHLALALSGAIIPK